MWIKISPKQFPSGMRKHEEVKYEEAEVDRLVAILKTNDWRRRTVWNTVSSPPRRGLLNYIMWNQLHSVESIT